MKPFLTLVLGLFLVSCGKETATGSGNAVIRLQLPATLAKGTARYQRFVSRVERLEMRLNSTKEKERTYTFPTQQWDSIQLPSFPFPQSDADKLEISVAVWDRKRDGFSRTFAIMTGHQSVTAEEFKAAKPAEIKLRLTLQVSPGEYD